MTLPVSKTIEDINIVRRPAEAAVLLHPMRLTLLKALTQPNSASRLARTFSLPRQKVNYHLRELEKGGFVRQVEERRRGNCMERIVQATARTYLISPEALGELGADPGRVQDRFSVASLASLAGRILRDLAWLTRRAESAGKRLSTFSLETEVRFASAQDRSAFFTELTRAVGHLVSRFHDDKAAGGRLHRLVIGGLPAITNPPEEHENHERE